MQEIIVGRPRDGSDRVTWLLDHSRFEQALNIIESDVTLSQATREQARPLITLTPPHAFASPLIRIPCSYQHYP